MKTAREQYASLLRHTALGLAAALLIARSLIPGEDAAQGTGLLFVLLWLLAAVLAALGCAVGRDGVYRAHLVDWAVVVLVLAQVASAVFVAAARRPALNMAWEWVALGLAYWLVRQLASSPKPQRALATVMVAMAFSLSLHGMYQRFWAIPQLRADYERNADAMLSELGIAPGDWDQEQFRRRLYSGEPFATFALANSLAGFLLPWFIVVLGAVVQREAPGDASPDKPGTGRRKGSSGRLTGPRVGWGIVILAALGACLLLTHSRTALAGAWVGGMFLLVVPRRNAAAPSLTRRARWAFGMIAVGITVLSVGIARGMDHPLVINAFEAVAYRVEYWRGAWRMIEAHPMWGVGPANFRQHYVRFKLPEAGEEVLDPHNLVLDVWTTGGPLAMAGLTAALVLFGLRVLGRRGAAPTQPASSAPVFVGAAAGWLVGYVDVVPADRLVGLALGWALGLVFARGLFHRRELDSTWLLAGAAALAVNLAGQGGIAIPPVAQNLWLILAVGIGATAGSQCRQVRLGPIAAWSVTVAATAVAILFVTTTYGPVTRSRLEMVAAQEQMRRGNRTSAVDHAKQAAAADPLSTGPWIWLLQAYRFEGGSSQAAPGGAWFAQAVDAAEQVIQRDPYWLEGHKSVGDLYLQHARRTESKTSANEAVRAYRRCVELYPTSARRLGDLSDALWQNGETQEARARAQEALQAEQLTKHPEKHLHPEVRRRLHERIGAADRVSPPSPGTASSRRASTDG